MILKRLKHKLSYSYTERNALLTPRNWPLMPLSSQRIDVQAILPKYAHIQHTPLPAPEIEPLETFGRISNIRRSGRNLTFIDLEHDNHKIQVVVNFKKMKSPGDEASIDLLRKGDAIQVGGWPWRTKAGELSVLCSSTPTLLAPCLRPPPTELNEGVKRNNRVAELKAFAEARSMLKTRDIVTTAVAQFLKARGFTQVQTPILSSQIGGASATPFVTTEGPVLRVAPELYLKRLIIGGFERVFEIGQSFRNEGVDATHNPEFTTCEFYQTFTTLEDLIDLTKGMFEHVAAEVHASGLPLRKFDWRVVDFCEELDKIRPLPVVLNLESLHAYFAALGLPIDPAASVPKLLDTLAGLFIEDKCTHPTFIVNHPPVLAPLAKQTTKNINGIEREISRRFELVMDGREYVNAYEEENDPALQLHKLQEQAQSEQVADADYVEDMQWGLPPTGGWGLGIDRLVMFFTGATRINQVLAFGIKEAGAQSQGAQSTQGAPEGAQGDAPEAELPSS